MQSVDFSLLRLQLLRLKAGLNSTVTRIFVVKSLAFFVCVSRLKSYSQPRGKIQRYALHSTHKLL